MANQAVLVYDVFPIIKTVAQITSQLEGVVLPEDNLARFGVTRVSDVTVVDGDHARRTLTYALLPQFVQAKFAPISPQTVPFRGTIVSSDPDDTVDGAGVTRVSFLYDDAAGVRKQSLASMKGTTPVAFLAKDHVAFASLLPLVGTPQGQIAIYSDGGEMVGRILKNFQGSIVSTQPWDTALGIGAREVTITYLDQDGGGPHTEVVALNGQSFVNLVNTNLATITNMAVTSMGSSNGNLGVITLMSGLNGTGGVMGRLNESFYTFFPQGTFQKGLFKDLFSYVIGAALNSDVTAADPVIT